MTFKKGTPVLHIPLNKYEDEAAIGIIVDVDHESVYQYKIVFQDHCKWGDDWYTDDDGDVTEMVQNYRDRLL
jgi:hypothetical protein